MSVLQHHGVKGQKWGVRRYQNPDGTRTEAGKKRYSDSTIFLKKGSTIKRTTMYNKDYKSGRRTYVSINDDDAKKWRDFFSRYYRNPYEHEYKTKKDLYVASGKDLVHIIDKEFKTEKDRVLFDNDVRNVNLVFSGETSRKAPDGVNQKAYDASSLMRVYSSSRMDTDSGKKIVHALKKAGFDGLVDSFGQDVSETPVILFDYEDKLKRKKTRNVHKIQRRERITHFGIGGPMYIEGSTLVMDVSYLEHHGILGQKWGVRRFQNPDGTRTAAGKKRAARTVRNAIQSMSTAREFSVADTPYAKSYTKASLKRNEEFSNMAFDIMNHGKHKAEYDDASRDMQAAAEYQYEDYSKKRNKFVEVLARKSLASIGNKNPSDEEVAEESVYWDEMDADYDDPRSNPYDRYIVSRGENPNKLTEMYKNSVERINKLALQDAEDALGEYSDMKVTFKDEITGKKVTSTAKKELASRLFDEATSWIDNYDIAIRAYDREPYTQAELDEMKTDNEKYLSMAQSGFFVEDGTLYLAHHGILGQKWGVRRFQNKDGSLTTLGRKKLGYAVKGAGNLAKKAASASFNAGKKAVAVAKEKKAKAEEEKLAARKAKASKTRVGVLANKDLFTSKEMEELNKRFKLEDEMKLDVLNKGMAYVDAIGKVGKAASSVGKAYKDLTGEEMFKNAIEEKREEAKKKKAEAEKAEKEAEKKKTADAISNAQTQKQQLMTKIADKKRAKEDAEKAEVKARIDEYNERIALKKEAKERDVYNKVQEKKAAYEAQKERSKKNKQIETEADDEVKRIMDRTKTVAEDISKTYLNRGGEKTKTVSRGLDAKANQNESLNKQVKDVSSALTSVANQMKSQTNQTKKDIKTNNLKRYADSKSDASNEKLERSATLLARQIKLVQSKIDNSDRQNKPTISQQEDVRKLRELSALTEQYQKAANDPRNDPTELTERYLKKGKRIMAGLKHSDIYSDESLSHYGVLGMKWGKHIMKGKGSLSVNDSGGGGGGAPEEEEEDDENLFEYSTDGNMLPGKKHYNKSSELQKIANDNKADLIAARKAAQKATSDADALEKKVKSVNIFNDRKGYLISEQRAKDKKRVKELRAQAKASEKEAAKHQKALTENSKKALKEYNKWQSSPSGQYDNMMRKKKRVRHSGYLIEDGTLYLCHHGIKGQRWGVRRFQNADGTRTEAGKKRDAKLAEKAEKFRNKDLNRYSKRLSGYLSNEDRRRYEALSKYTKDASQSDILKQYTSAKKLGIGYGIASTISLSMVGVPNIASIPIGMKMVGIMSERFRDNYRVRELNAQHFRESVEAELAAHSGFFVEDGTLYLEHHGILGQKWGVRRFQDAAGRLTALGKEKLKDARSAIKSKIPSKNGETDETSIVPGGGGGDDWDEVNDELLNQIINYLYQLSDEELAKFGIKRSDIENAKTKDDFFKIAQKFRETDYSDPGKQRLMFSILTAALGSNLLSIADPLKITGDAVLAELKKASAEVRKSREDIDPNTGFHIKSNQNATKEDDLKAVNPGYKNLSENSKNNCMLCTTTYDLRRRGYDVTAEEVREGYNTTDVKRWYPDAEIRHVEGATTTQELNDKTVKAILSQGDGARGNLMVQWQGGGGHSMAYEVENGKVVIYDCQTGEKHDTWDVIQNTWDVSYARLDNVEPDWDRVKEASN